MSESYIHSLKQIKEREDKVQTEIDTHKRQVDSEMAKLDFDLKDAVSSAKLAGQASVESAVAQARQKAQKEAEQILSDATAKSKTLHLNQQGTKQVIDILLSGIQ